VAAIWLNRTSADISTKATTMASNRRAPGDGSLMNSGLIEASPAQLPSAGVMV
jgi:hypothetical protein